MPTASADDAAATAIVAPFMAAIPGHLGSSNRIGPESATSRREATAVASVDRRNSLRNSLVRLSLTLDALEVGHVQQDDAVAVQVSKTVYVVVWLLTLAARVFCIAFLAGTTRVYWFIAHPYMSYYASLLGPRAVDQFKPIGVCFGIVAAIHAVHLAQMIYYSIKLRRLVLDAPSWKSTSTSSSIPSPPTLMESLRRADGPVAWIRVAASSLRVRYRKLFDRKGFFGVESEFFHVRFVSRELVEILSQTAQVYNSSVLIAKIWINNLYVVLMLINCCSTPLLQALFHKTPALERLLCLCVDLALDAAVSMLLPLVIFVPYVQKFDFASFNFEISYLYDDIWFANMVMENQQLFALTNWDFLWKIVPHLSMLGCLSNLNALIRANSRSRRSNKTTTLSGSIWSLKSARVSVCSTQPVAVALPPGLSELSSAGSRGNLKTTDPLEAAAATSSPSKAQLHQQQQQQAKPQRKRRPSTMAKAKGGRVLKAVNLGMILWGVGILVCHVLAMRTSLSVTVRGCKQATRPWFATKFSCSVLEYNCHLYNTTYVRDEDLAVLQDDSLAALVFSHCPQLRVPPRIRAFRNLLGVDIFNSTLCEWSVDAAITNVSHPRLAYIIFVRVNMTRLPDGILQKLPASMTDFEICVTNLTHLPDDLHAKWHPMSLLYVEYSQIATFPSTLLYLPVDDLSLIGSQIEELPEFPVDHGGFFTLAMTRTPLRTLPSSMGDLTAIGFLNLGFTQLTEFPPWMDQVVKTATKIFVHHTPFCASKSDDEISKEYGDQAVLTCTMEGDRQDGKYPLALMETRRLYDRPSSQELQ